MHLISRSAISHPAGRRLLLALTLSMAASVSLAQTPTQMKSPTVITVNSSVQQTSVKRLGINIGGQLYWDSGQIMKNLAFRNPGFEGETWQSILHCKAVTANSCTDDNPWSVWPANFFQGAQANFIDGGNNGLSATITQSTAVNSAVLLGVTVTFSSLANPVAVGDYLVVKFTLPGNAQAGWWTSSSGGGSFATDTTDLSPETPGKQALELNALGTGQNAGVSSYFDTTASHSFLQLNGAYTINFRAKGLGGSNQVYVQVRRLLPSGSVNQFFSQMVNLSSGWQDYSYTFNASESGETGGVQLGFDISGGAMYLDDVTLTPTNGSWTNPTAFRDEVVSTLKTLHPGVIRYMDSGTNWGSSLDNMLAPPFARVRPGYSNYNTESDDIPIGLHEFLVLCQTVGAEPWYTMQAGMSTQEMTALMEYLGGSSTTVYGAKRAALGQTLPWTSVFPTIHLEFGNEVWNGSNSGASMADPVAYGKRAGVILGLAHASPYYSASGFDLIVNGWLTLPWWNQQVLGASSNYDTIDIAPYLYGYFGDDSSTEAIFGPMFAEPEMLDSSAGGFVLEQAQVAAAASKPAKLAVYETQVSPIRGTVPQASVDATAPSIAGGIAQAAHMLTMMRDDGILDQNLFALPGYEQAFYNPASATSESSQTFGAVRDMGNGNVMRPTFLAEQLVNEAILPTMLTATQSGANPTWNQAASTNDSVALNGAHYLQSFAFTDGTTNNLVLFNLSRTKPLSVELTGTNAPLGNVAVQTLTSANLTDNNERGANIAVAKSTITLAVGQILSLPPFSMTLLSAPVMKIPGVTEVTVTCTPSSLTTGTVSSCSASVTGTGSYSSAVVWTTSAGSITQSGQFTAPLTATNVKVTATSAQTPAISGSASLVVTAPAVTGIAVICTPSSLTTGTVSSCSASVTGTGSYSSAVAWTTSAGSITQSGQFTAPLTATNVKVTATSAQTPAISGSASLVVTAPAVTGIAVICTPSSLTTGTVSSCSASVTGTGSYSSAVVWTTSAGSITQSGQLTAPSTATTVIVKATSRQTPTVSGSAPVAVTTTPATTISSVVTSVNATTATISWETNVLTSSGVDWGTTQSYGSVTPWTNATTKTPSYTLTRLRPGTTYYLVLWSYGPTGEAAVSLHTINTLGVTGIAVTCTPTSLTSGSIAVCSANVSGSGNFSSAVSWTTSAGTISQTGQLTAPLTAATVRVTATSTQSPTVSGSTSVAVTAPAVNAIAVSCTPSAVTAGSVTACSASLTGAGAFNSGVVWTTSAGTISQTGQLTAPSTPTTAVVKATSKQTPAISGSVSVNVSAGPAPTISSVVTSVSSTTANISWTTNVITSSGIDWGKTTSYGAVTPWTNVTSKTPAYTLTGLTPGTIYYLVLWSFDALGRQVLSLQRITTTK